MQDGPIKSSYWPMVCSIFVSSSHLLVRPVGGRSLRTGQQLNKLTHRRPAWPVSNYSLVDSLRLWIIKMSGGPAVSAGWDKLWKCTVSTMKQMSSCLKCNYGNNRITSYHFCGIILLTKCYQSSSNLLLDARKVSYHYTKLFYLLYASLFIRNTDSIDTAIDKMYIVHL